MKKKSTLFIIFMVCILVILGLIIGLNLMSEKKIDNLFRYVVTISDGNFSPSYLEFDMTVDEVLEAIQAKREANLEYISIPPEGKEPIVTSEFDFLNLSEKVVERCNFDKEVLCSVEYQIYVTKEEKEQVCIALYEQAKEYMPEAFSDNFDSIKTDPVQGQVMWKDSSDTYVRLSFPSVYGTDKELIVLSIHKAINKGIY